MKGTRFTEAGHQPPESTSRWIEVGGNVTIHGAPGAMDLY